MTATIASTGETTDSAIMTAPMAIAHNNLG
jgi:hypothetical protein